ncbi:MAG: 30S ribosomal protein S7 [Spirochaetales bacterium]|nr:30S ribosomal protein S7 [Spirochaetales bacterium]
MSRRRAAEKRPITPDSKYSSKVVSKFISRMMIDGKKSVSRACVYGAMEYLAEKTEKEALEVFLKAVDNVKPMVEVKSRRVGGSTYQIPMEVGETRKEALSMRWLIAAARKRNGRTMSQKLGAELLDAFNSTGTAFKKKEDVHRMAEANKAFSHYR